MTLRSRDFWFVLALALLVLGIGIGLRDPWPADEPRFVLLLLVLAWLAALRPQAKDLPIN